MTDVKEPATAQDSRPSPWEVGRARAPQRRKLLIGFGTFFVVIALIFGFPTGREVITAWLLVFLLVVVGGDWVAWRRAVGHDWAPFLVALFAYDLLRGFAKGSIDRAHVLPQLKVDEFLFGGTAPTVRLQEHLYHPDPRWYDIAIVPVYMSHFLVPIAVAAALWATSYQRFTRFVATFMTLTALTLVTYAAFPAVPPWLAATMTDSDGKPYLPPVTRVVSHTLVESGIPTIQSAVERGEAFANPVAAVPSFHAAVPMLVLLLFWPAARAWVRALLVAYVSLMAFTLVYGAEHYASDILLGWLYAGLSVLAVSWFTRRRQRAATS